METQRNPSEPIKPRATGQESGKQSGGSQEHDKERDRDKQGGGSQEHERDKQSGGSQQGGGGQEGGGQEGG